MELNDLGKAQYVALETFKKNGEGVKTPVWITAEADKLYVWTGGNSWKVKRIRNNSRVRLAESDSGGKVKGEWVEAQARILDDDEALAQQAKRLAAKYGLMFRVISLMLRLRRPKGGYVVIEIQRAS